MKFTKYTMIFALMVFSLSNKSSYIEAKCTKNKNNSMQMSAQDSFKLIMEIIKTDATTKADITSTVLTTTVMTTSSTSTSVTVTETTTKPNTSTLPSSIAKTSILIITTPRIFQGNTSH